MLLSTPAWATWTLIQHPCNTTCAAGTSCAVTVTSTGSGHLGVAFAIMDKAGATATVTSVSGGGTYTLCGATCNGVDATAGDVDAAYTLNSSSGATSVTVNVSASIAVNWTACYREYSSSTTFAFDTANNRDQSSAVANPAGVAVTLTGSNDVIVQWGAFSGSCSGAGTYGNADFPNNNGIADLLNTGSGSANTWTATSGRAALAAIAFKETSGATCNNRVALLGAGCS